MPSSLSLLVVAVATICLSAHLCYGQQTYFSVCPSSSSKGRSIPRDGSFAIPSVLPPGDWEITEGTVSNCPAWGYYSDMVDENGWGYLAIETNTDGSYDVGTQYYTAGYLEAFLMCNSPTQPQPGNTQNRIYQSKLNTILSGFPNGTIPQSVYTFMQQQNSWLTAMIQSNPDDAYWQTIQNVYTQMQGMSDAYQLYASSDEPVSLQDFNILNIWAEISDILSAVDPDYRASRDVLKMHDFKKVKQIMEENSHCSALIRIAPDGSDLMSTHTTWSQYQNMLRTYKFYNIGNNTAQHFSGYPACLSSTDDYYQTGENLIVIETTNSVANMTLYDYVKPSTVPCFVRVVVSNQLTSNGQDWTEMFSLYNSGTYNNQWMVVDNKLFQNGIAQPGTLWIASQCPGRVDTQDVTSILNSQGYWASYNIPFFHDLWVLMGYEGLVQQYGEWGTYMYDYEKSFRALIFARDAPNVTNIAGMQAIIQENNFETDPLSKGCADLAVASRMDLPSTPNPLSSPPTPGGAIDAKLSSASMMASSLFQVLAKCGPTIENQPPFVWSTSQWANLSHVGMPDEFNFDWVNFMPSAGVMTRSSVNQQRQPSDKIMTE